MTDRPWLKFYTADWRADPRLRSCSLAARGLWMEMLCLMHEAEPYGHLLVNGRPVGDRRLAVLCGATPDELAAAKAELEAAGVFSLGDDGVVFSRRMVRDKARSEQGREWGKRGGNPALTAPRQTPAATDSPGVKASRGRGPESRDQSPDPIGSDAHSANTRRACPLDLKARLYGDCRLWLEQAAGLAQAGARAQIGKWLKGGGKEQRLIAAFLEAQRCSAADPIPYITRLMQLADEAPSAGPSAAKERPLQVSRLAHLRNKRRKRDHGIAYLSAEEEAELAALEAAPETGAVPETGTVGETDAVPETNAVPEAIAAAPDFPGSHS